MDRRFERVWGFCAAAAAAGLVFRSDLAAEGVREGIALCLQTVIPSLFAFMVLSGLLAGSGDGAVFAPFRLLARAYRLPEEAAPALALGLTGGYPVGARMAAELKKAGRLTAEQGAALLCCAFGPSPAFLCGIGEMVFGSRKVGLAVWCAVLVGSVPVGWLAGRGLRPEERPAVRERAEKAPFPERLVGSVLSATRAMGVICGFTVAFAALRRYLLLLPGGWGKFAAAFCEVSVGCMAAGEEGYMAALILVTGCCCMGGVSVWMQNACFLKGSGIPMEKFFLSRVLHLFFSLSAVLLFERLFSMSEWAAESVFSSFAEAAPQMGAGSAASSAFLVACCMLLLTGKGVSVRRKQARKAERGG